VERLAGGIRATERRRIWPAAGRLRGRATGGPTLAAPTVVDGMATRATSGRFYAGGSRISKRGGICQTLRSFVAAAASVTVLLVLPASAAASAPALGIAPAAAPPTTKISVSGSGFDAAESVRVSFDGVVTASTAADPSGAFAGAGFAIPADAQPGTHTVAADGVISGHRVQRAFSVRTNWPAAGFSSTNSFFNPFENALTASSVAGLGEKCQVSGQSDSAVVANGVLYVGSSWDDQRSLSAYDATSPAAFDCRELWTTRLDGAGQIGTPLVAGGRVFVTRSGASDTGALFALSRLGQVVWKLPVASPGALFSDNGRLYLGTGGVAPSLHAVDPATGRELWRVPTSDTRIVAVASGRLFTASSGSDGQAAAYDAASGARLWSAHTGFALGSGAVANGRFYLTGAAAVAALDVRTGRQLWQAADLADAVGPPAVANGKVYVLAVNRDDPNNCRPTALDARTGGVVLRAPAYPRCGTRQPVVAGNILYFGGDGNDATEGSFDTGELFVADASTGNELRSLMLEWSADASERSAPIVVNGRVYVPGYPSGLEVFGLPST
jgi:outer membrane protein assembly factor BamB